MILKEFIQRVQANYSKGLESDDTRLSSRLIYNKLLTVRSRILSQEAKKKQRLSSWNYQVISCIELVKAPSHDCPCIEPVGCEILRTKYPLPQPVQGLQNLLIQSVTSVERSLKFDEISINSVNYIKDNKYTGNKINYFIYNNYIYIIANIKLKAIALTGLFQDPIEAILYKGLCENTCVNCDKCVDYLNIDLPIESSMIDTLVELTNQELLVFFTQSIEDVSNNSVDSLKQQTK